MKRFPFLVFILVIIVCGCQTQANQHKAEKLVIDYLKKTPGAAESYKGMGFDSLREQHDQFITAEPEGRHLDSISSAFGDSSMAYKKRSDEALMAKVQDMAKAKLYLKMDSTFAAKSDSISKIIQQKSKGYAGKGTRFVINHTYKINNNLGKLTQRTTTFWFDKDLTKIEHTQEAN